MYPLKIAVSQARAVRRAATKNRNSSAHAIPEAALSGAVRLPLLIKRRSLGCRIQRKFVRARFPSEHVNRLNYYEKSAYFSYADFHGSAALRMAQAELSLPIRQIPAFPLARGRALHKWPLPRSLPGRRRERDDANVPKDA